jgi:hypothetical protein
MLLKTKKNKNKEFSRKQNPLTRNVQFRIGLHTNCRKNANQWMGYWQNRLLLSRPLIKHLQVKNNLFHKLIPAFQISKTAENNVVQSFKATGRFLGNGLFAGNFGKNVCCVAIDISRPYILLLPFSSTILYSHYTNDVPILSLNCLSIPNSFTMSFNSSLYFFGSLFFVKILLISLNALVELPFSQKYEKDSVKWFLMLVLILLFYKSVYI